MKKLSIPFDSSRITEAVYFIQESLKTTGVRNQQLKETVLIAEELIVKVFEREDGKPHNEYDTIDIGIRRTLTGHVVTIGYNGGILKRNNTENDIGNSILKHYSDRISYRYGAGRNRVSVFADNTYSAFLRHSLISVILACIVTTVLMSKASSGFADKAHYVCAEITQLFCNALSVIAPIVTLFSIVMAIALIARTAGGYSWTKRILGTVFSTSFISVAIGGGLGYLLCYLFVEKEETDGGAASELFYNTLITNIKEIVPSSLMEVFTGNNSLQLIVVAIISGIAVAEASNTFSKVDDVFRALYTFFCDVLSILYSISPIIIFTAVTSMLMKYRVNIVIVLGMYFITFYIGILLLSVIYIMHIKANGLNLKMFISVFKNSASAIFHIGSTRDAIPYVKRTCYRKLKISNEILDESVPIISHLNMDGNCMVIGFLTVVGMYKYYVANPTVTGFIITVVLIMIISTGAPAQPGSIIISIAVVTPILGVDAELIQVALIMDVFVGAVIALYTSFTTMVVASVEAKKEGYIDKDFNKLRD